MRPLSWHWKAITEVTTFVTDAILVIVSIVNAVLLSTSAYPWKNITKHENNEKKAKREEALPKVLLWSHVWEFESQTPKTTPPYLTEVCSTLSSALKSTFDLAREIFSSFGGHLVWEGSNKEKKAALDLKILSFRISPRTTTNRTRNANSPFMF